MIIEVLIPSPGESITEVAIGNWLVQDGDIVDKDQEIADVETDKATLPLIAPESGKIKIEVRPGEKIQVGDVACRIDTIFAVVIPATREKHAADHKTSEVKDFPSAAKLTDEADLSVASSDKLTAGQADQHPAIKITPLARRKMEGNKLSVDDIIKGLRKITTAEVDLVIKNDAGSQPEAELITQGGRQFERLPMSPLRRKLAKRLVAVRNETAMLTTFNEVDMSGVLELRRKYQQPFQNKHGIKLGLMSFFAKAATQALLQYPGVNSAMEGEQIITPSFVDLGIAVQTEKGLMVPVIRNVQSMSIAELEKQIAGLAQKARNNRITLEEMTGGTFTITNGGVFGSMLSTPILNPPQSAILGMHNIVERPVAVQGKVEIRPIMYVALSYDHRIIDGASSVGFLVTIKELIESPMKMMSGADHEKDLLGI
jgi:2-oxoglutarate dehydrogenase E2 component (dihydrolipoamide succinyltransferase)